MVEYTRYYSFRYSNICYGISGFLCARYNASLVNLQNHCDGCGTSFVVTHTLIFNIRSLVIARHNEISDEPYIYPDMPSPQHLYAPNP